MKKLLIFLLTIMTVSVVKAKEINFVTLFESEQGVFTSKLYSTGDKIVNIVGAKTKDTCEFEGLYNEKSCYDLEASSSRIFGEYSPASYLGSPKDSRSIGDESYHTTPSQYNIYSKNIIVKYYYPDGTLYKQEIINHSFDYQKWQDSYDPSEILISDLDGKDTVWSLRYIATNGSTTGDESMQLAFVAEDFKSYYDLKCACGEDNPEKYTCELKYNSKTEPFNSNVNILKSSFKLNITNSDIINIKDYNGNSITNNDIALERDYQSNTVMDLITFEIEKKTSDTGELSITVLKTQEGYKDTNDDYLFLEREYQSMNLNIDHTKCINSDVMGEEVDVNPKTGIEELVLYIIPLTILLVLFIISNKDKVFKKI